LGAIAPRVLDAAALQRRDDTAYVHERDIWERVCGNMVDLMDVGCGHNAPNVEAHILKSPLCGGLVDNYTRALTFENVCGGNAR